jgi:hypothetical protein
LRRLLLLSPSSNPSRPKNAPLCGEKKMVWNGDSYRTSSRTISIMIPFTDTSNFNRQPKQHSNDIGTLYRTEQCGGNRSWS